MLLDAEAKVAVVGEVLLPQLVLLHLEAPLQDLLGLYCQNQLCVWQKPVDVSCFVKVSWPFMFNHLNQAKDGDKNNHHKEITSKQFHQITLGPLTVQWTEIFSFLLIPKLRTV